MDTLRSFTTGSGSQGHYYSLPALREQGIAPGLDRLPVSIRIVLESVLRNCDGHKVSEQDVRNLANWNAKDPGSYEVPFTVARVVLQDFTGVPLVVDLAAMRDAARTAGVDPSVVEPLVPVDLVIDHSVQVDFAGSQDALDRNLAIEFFRNRERYEFLKWGQQAFETFGVVPPGIGIVHQVNLEYLAKGVLSKDGVYYPDTLVGTDSHTTMINGLGVVGWGVGGIEAEAGMLGQPVTFLVPEVVGVYLYGRLAEGVTATDLTLRVTQILRTHGVVGKFVEFYGPGAEALSLPDRATIANMAPEYGATMGFFPVDEETISYLKGTGRSEELCAAVRNYYTAQGLFGIPAKGQIDFSSELELDLSTIVPSVAGPKRPQDRVDVSALAETFNRLFTAPVANGGFGRTDAERNARIPLHLSESAGYSPEGASLLAEAGTAIVAEPLVSDGFLGHGSVLIAAITSCTNTSNPSVMLAAGLLAKKANALGLKIAPYVKTSLGPGSRVVTDYLEATGLQTELDALGFQTVGYGCTTCIGNSGPLSPAIEEAITAGDLVCASVLSGNRNFEARVHGSIRANFLMSPPLVVAYALAGRVDLDLTNDPLGTDFAGNPVFLKNLWPTHEELREVMDAALQPAVFQRLYSNLESANPNWAAIQTSTGATYTWNEKSTYIQNPPFLEGFTGKPNAPRDLTGARALGIFADSVTTDHISPAGNIVASSPAGQYLIANGETTEKVPFVAGKVTVDKAVGPVGKDPLEEISFVLFYPNQSVRSSRGTTPSLSLFSAKYQSGRVERSRQMLGAQSTSFRIGEPGTASASMPADLYLPLGSANVRQEKGSTRLTLSFMGVDVLDDYLLALNVGGTESGHLTLKLREGGKETYDVSFLEKDENGNLRRNLVVAGLDRGTSKNYGWYKLGNSGSTGLLTLSPMEMPFETRRTQDLVKLIQDRQREWQLAMGVQPEEPILFAGGPAKAPASTYTPEIITAEYKPVRKTPATAAAIQEAKSGKGELRADKSSDDRQAEKKNGREERVEPKPADLRATPAGDTRQAVAPKPADGTVLLSNAVEAWNQTLVK